MLAQPQLAVPPAPKVHDEDLPGWRVQFEFSRNTVSIQPTRAFEGPWCSHYFGTDYTENCSMRSFDMCIAETRGAGGTFCSPNPRYHAVAVAPGTRRHQGASPHPM